MGRTAFALLAGGLALAALSAPLLGAAGHPVAYFALHGIFSRICHQEPQRSFMIDGFAVAVCARCLGIYLGAAAGCLASFWRTLRPDFAINFFWASVAANVLDVGAEMLHLHGNMPVMRLLFGIAFGSAAAILVIGKPAAVAAGHLEAAPVSCKSSSPPAE